MADINPVPILLRNCEAVLVHDSNDKVSVVKLDVLIEGGKISKLAHNISSPNAEVIDCTNKIVSPGFVDTHHHVWQTQLKGRHGNDTLIQYFPHGNFSSQLYSAADVFWGQLGGCLEMIHCGTTTVCDFAHINYRPENNHNAISATASSGIRSVYCYNPTPRTISWDPFAITYDILGDHVMPTYRDLAGAAPFGDGRVTLGFAFDAFQFLPQDQLDMLTGEIRKSGISLITVHYNHGPTMGNVSVPELLENRGCLDARFLMAHSGNMTTEDARLYRKRGVHLSSTPSSEYQMGMGVPVPAFRKDLDLTDLCSLGVDCHSLVSAFIPGEARLALQGARAIRGQEYLDQGKQAKSVGPTVEEAFNQATIRGAHSMKMADKIGSIAVGKFADLIIFDAHSPSMICAGVHDPLAAIMLHSSPADIDMVIVGGVIRKRASKLVSTKLDERGSSVAGRAVVSWPEVAKALLESREAIQQRMAGVDMKAAEVGAMKAFHINEADIVDEI